MPFIRPTLTELRQQALTDMMSAPGGDGMGLLRRAVSRVLSWALGNLAHGLHGHLDWVAKQSVPFTADGENLEAWAALVGVTRKPAVAWAGTASWSGVAGTVIPVNTVLSGPDAGIYTVSATVVVGSGGSVVAPIGAVLTGTTASLDNGETVRIASGIAGISGDGVVTGTTQPGVDLEQDDPFKTRMLLRWASPPQGGAATDYIEWALAVPGVTRAWANPLGAGPGTVVVYTMWDTVRAPTGFPVGSDGVASDERRAVSATSDQLVVANAIYPLRPVAALVWSVAPLAYAVAFTIVTRAAVATAVRNAAQAALDGVFLDQADPLHGVLDTSPFEVALAGVTGMPRFTLTVPAGEIQAPLGYLPVRGAVTWSVSGV